MRYFIIILSIFLIGACKSSTDKKGGKKEIEDLPFAKAENAKAYADLILKSLRTNRDKPIYDEYADPTSVNADSLDYYIGMYSTGIGGRDDWEFVDVFAGSTNEKDSGVYDYAWLDPSGRLGIQVKIKTKSLEGSYALEGLELRSRLNVMNSKALPGGEISNYEKLEYDWDADLKRKLEAQKK